MAVADAFAALVAGEMLEYAALLSTISADDGGFERHVVQVKAYYADFKCESCE